MGTKSGVRVKMLNDKQIMPTEAECIFTLTPYIENLANDW